MRTTRTFPLMTAGAILLLSGWGDAWAGVFRGPWDYSVGPYRYGQSWNYFESYNYFGVNNVASYPYWATGTYNYFWESPFTWGNGSRYPSLLGRYRPGFYNPINPAYLTPPRAPGYTKESARNVLLPAPNQLNFMPAMIDVKMPCYGELWVDGAATNQLGTDRLFCSPPLEKGAEYVYVLKARWVGPDGKPIEQRQEVHVHCGERLRVVFPKPPPDGK
jgi:uncharacterized protein (TIGR03000 family)